MNINQLRYFVAVVDLGSYRKAAELLSVSQPALSNSIRTLEEAFQVPLLERGKGGVKPTAYGTTVYHFFKSALDSMKRARKEVEFLRKGAKGHVAVGAPTGMIDQLLPGIITKVSSRESRLTFSVKYGYLNDLLTSLRRGELDFLLTPYWPGTDLSGDLQFEKYLDLRISIYARSEHPLARKSSVSLEDLLAARWILPESAGMRTFLKQIFGDGPDTAVNWSITHDYPPFMIRMLMGLDLLSLIPDYTVSDWVKSGALRRLNYPAFAPKLSAGLVSVASRSLTPAMRVFADTAGVAAREMARRLKG
jgi:DNA-binding transcriptional LysR family regulator